MDGIEQAALWKNCLRPSLDSVLLCHYLIRRISISKKRKRGNAINFATVREVTGFGGEAVLLRKKAAAVMNHYQKAGFLETYYLYVTGCVYRLTDGRSITDLACFRARAVEMVKDVRLSGGKHPDLSDLLMSWTPEGGKKLPDVLSRGGSLCAKTKRELARMPIGRMEGILLLN